jgi:hypothetical protein
MEVRCMSGERIDNYRSALLDALGRPIPLEGELRVWLDDDLVDREAPEGWVHARTAREACLLILTGRVVELSLDNDLSDGRRLKDDGSIHEDDIKRPVGRIEFGTGYQVVEFLKEVQGTDNAFLWPRDGINLHTANPDERDRMAQSIESLERLQGFSVERTDEGGQPRLVVRLDEDATAAG